MTYNPRMRSQEYFYLSKVVQLKFFPYICRRNGYQTNSETLAGRDGCRMGCYIGSCLLGRQGTGLQDIASAADSDSYYMALMQQHKRWYAEMSVDSMVASSER